MLKLGHWLSISFEERISKPTIKPEKNAVLTSPSGRILFFLLSKREYIYIYNIEKSNIDRYL